jgi:ribosome-associated toxin RatA of RatAB toxin-antitoxin module
VNRVEATTVVRQPPKPVYDLLVDFSRYAKYSKYLDEVTKKGDGGVGTEYHLAFRWWKLSYTVHSMVTGVEAPQRIRWEIQGRLDAHGEWEIEELADPPAGAESASRIHFRVWFDPDSVDGGAIDLPSFVSLDWVVGKAVPKIRGEAERVVGRIVADLEGKRRPVELMIHDGTD